MRRLLLCLLAVAVAAPAGAALRTISYQAEVSAVPTPLAGLVTVGDPLTGSFTFESDTADSNPDPTIGFYDGAVHRFTLGAYTGESTQSFLRIYDDGSTPAFDAYQVVDFAPADELDPIGGRSVEALYFLVNAGTTLFSSDAIPPGLPPFMDPSVFEARIRVEVSLPEGGVGQLIAEIVSVPEPSQVGVAGVALAALAALARVPSVQRRIAPGRMKS